MKVRRIQSILVAETVATYDPCEIIMRARTAARILQKNIGNSPKEIFSVLVLGGKNNLIGYEEVSVGTVNTALVHPREVFGSAIRLGGVSILVGHNHPSGDPTPSQEDIVVTERLKKAGKILGITLLDHVIIGEYKYSSYNDDWIIRGLPE